MVKVYILFSHKLTKNQIEELRERFNCEEFVYLPESLQKMWSEVGDEDNRKIFYNYLKENCQMGDLVLVQGEWGLTHSVVNYCKRKKYIPIYATTQRNAVERKEGEKVYKTSVFEHVKFKKY